MKFKILIIIIIAASFVFTACSTDIQPQETAQKTAQTTFTPKPTARITPEPMPTVEPEINRFTNTGNLESFDNLNNLGREEEYLIDAFEYERIYFKLINVPEDMELYYLSFWTIGFLADYSNDETGEFINFKWIAATDIESYNEQIEYEKQIDDIDSTYEIVEKNGIEYFIHYFTFDRCVSDEICQIYFSAEIRWIEKEKCFYLGVSSLDKIDASVIEYCQIEEYKLP